MIGWRAGIARALLAVAVAGGTLVAGASPAAAAGPEQVDVFGHGWGHGRGMGQWGARGYADAFGWSADQILNHFYGNTTSATVDPNQVFVIYLCALENVPRDICSSGGVRVGAGLGDVVVTSGAAFGVEGNVVAAGRAVTLRRLADRFELWQAPGGCGAVGPWAPVGGGTSLDSNMDIESTVPAPASTSDMLRVCTPKNRFYRGVLDLTMDGSKVRLLNTVGLDDYLRGVVPAEMPASWNPSAVQAQTVAARSYALADGRFGTFADTCDTTQCQVYSGAGVEQPGSSAAIAATSGRIRTRNGSVISTEFSASTGGWTAGGSFPPVQDAGDGAAAGNPHHNWSVRLSDDQIEAAYGLTDLLDVRVTERNGLGAEGGRVTKMQVVGANKTVTVDGNAFRTTFGLKSDWFTPVPGAAPKELIWTTRTTATPGPPTGVVKYGGPTDRAIACDWDGDGDDTLGVYAGGSWYLRNDLAGGPPTIVASYGAPEYTPVCGDWDGNGTETIGVYTPEGWWLLRNDNAGGPPHVAFQYGWSAATPVVGNWDGFEPGDEIGIYHNGTWLLREDVGSGPPQRSVSYGYAGVRPVVGDWDGDGSDGIGVYDAGSWMLRETVTAGQPQRWFSYGYPGPAPITGRWSSGSEGVGIIEIG